jgi:hypothetical protein
MKETISRIDLAWLASFIEDEGWFSLLETSQKSKYGKPGIRTRCDVCVTNSDFYKLQKASELLFNLGISFNYGMKKGTNRWCLTIRVSGFRTCKKLLDLILPYLVGTGKDQAEIMFEFCEFKIRTYQVINDLVRNSNGQVQNKRNDTIEQEFITKIQEARIPKIDLQRLQRIASQPLSLR